jgi:hypothetical protein
MSSERYTAAQIIEALKATKGMVYLAADKLGCSHQTVYNYIERYPTVKAEWDAQNGKMGDTAELKLYQAVMNSEPWAVAFYLRTKGKSRGYTERQELTGADGGEVKIKVIYDDGING